MFLRSVFLFFLHLFSFSMCSSLLLFSYFFWHSIRSFQRYVSSFLYSFVSSFGLYIILFGLYVMLFFRYVIQCFLHLYVLFLFGTLRSFVSLRGVLLCTTLLLFVRYVSSSLHRYVSLFFATWCIQKSDLYKSFGPPKDPQQMASNAHCQSDLLAFQRANPCGGPLSLHLVTNRRWHRHWRMKLGRDEIRIEEHQYSCIRL